MHAVLTIAVVAAQRGDLRQFYELVGSWPVHVALLAVYAGLAVLAFTRVYREWDDASGLRALRATVVALGVFLACVVLLPVSLWLQLIAVMWLFGMWLYYTARFMTAPRRGRRNPAQRRRGKALEGVLHEARRERGS